MPNEALDTNSMSESHQNKPVIITGNNQSECYNKNNDIRRQADEFLAQTFAEINRQTEKKETDFDVFHTVTSLERKSCREDKQRDKPNQAEWEGKKEAQLLPLHTDSSKKLRYKKQKPARATMQLIDTLNRSNHRRIMRKFATRNSELINATLDSFHIDQINSLKISTEYLECCLKTYRDLTDRQKSAPKLLMYIITHQNVNSKKERRSISKQHPPLSG